MATVHTQVVGIKIVLLPVSYYNKLYLHMLCVIQYNLL